MSIWKRRTQSLILIAALSALAAPGCKDSKSSSWKNESAGGGEKSAAAEAGEAKFDVTCNMEYWSWGGGHCSLMNTGPAAGAICGKVKVVRYDNSAVVKSENICSGRVASKSVVEVKFKLGGDAESGCRDRDRIFSDPEDYCRVLFEEVK
jgi:hypothetical protein